MESSVESSTATAVNPPASARLRTTPVQPIRERAPKQPHGSPARPRRIAPTIVSAKKSIRPAPSQAASVEPATTAAASPTSIATRSQKARLRATGVANPSPASASCPARGLASFATAAPMRTPPSNRRSPISSIGDTLATGVQAEEMERS